MSAVTIISLLLIVAVMALVMVNYVNRRETRKRLVSQRVADLRRRMAELEEMAALIEPLLESTQVPRVINDEIIHLMETMIKLDNENSYLEPAITAAKSLSEDLALEQRAIPISRALGSDAQIARAKFHLNEAARLIRRQQLEGRLDPLEAETLTKELLWAALMIDVISFVDQGHIAMQQREVLKGYSYYKHAQQALIAHHHPDERRQRYIREVSEMLTNRRKALSEELMPESQNNPTENRPDAEVLQQAQQLQQLGDQSSAG